MKNNLIEIKSYDGDGYKPLVDFESWRVAVLNYADFYRPSDINDVQKHDETDEVFVLIKGSCILFLLDENGILSGVNLELGKVYNVKKSVWHNHALTEGSIVLVVENKNTNDSNSPIKELNEFQKNSLVNLSKELW